MTDQDTRTNWTKQIDLSEALKGAPPPSPMVGRWSDSVDGTTVHRALFYPNEVHSVGGEPEAMKSWLLLLASAQEINAGSHVLYLDMEANDRSIVDRLRLLGASKMRIKKSFHYFRPDERITEADQAWFGKLVRRHEPTLVVLDGVTEAYSLHGLSINAAEDAATWFRDFSRRFQVTPSEDYDGPAIVELDHVVKSRDERNGWAIGTQHKKAGIKGAMYIVESVAQFGKGKHGRSRLLLGKDSPGGVDWVPFKRQRYVGDLHCVATDDGVDAWIESPDIDVTAPDGPELPLVETYEFRLLMQQVSAFVAANPGCSKRRARDGVIGTNERIASALEALVAEGYVANEGTGNRSKYVSVKDFTAMKVVPGGGGG
ncbi:hypothetical protein QWJ41_20400 [Nocardioides sp. SOB44]|uniref:AAA family ATPase n=1 Tax=Nocardioides cremeus TaxID=3058044 RepID=A0ABT8TVW0_9ACTN|nr:hypothetical protein [Nocardioides cremeus]MDO3398095.1 hypothetical protein [Nocardioides cremeus]